jgi:dipeptidyl aminopeptidase/acylaminoacyl peptidase
MLTLKSSRLIRPLLASPSWSPDGTKIAFASDRDHAGQASVYVMNANGTNQQRLTFSADAFTDEQPVWSRDGSRIAFVSTRDSEVESWQETYEAGGTVYRTAVRTNLLRRLKTRECDCPDLNPYLDHLRASRLIHLLLFQIHSVTRQTLSRHAPTCRPPASEQESL